MKKVIVFGSFDYIHPGHLNFFEQAKSYGDYLIVVATHKRPFYLFEIHDKMLAHNMRKLFKKLWSTSD